MSILASESPQSSEAMKLAYRSVVQAMAPFHRNQTFGSEKTEQIRELATGYQATSSDFSHAIRIQQTQMSQDLRDVGLGEAASRVDERLGVSVARPERDY